VSTKSIHTKKIFFKKTLFLKNKYYPARNELISNQYVFNSNLIRFLIDNHFLWIINNLYYWIINNLFIKYKIDYMFLKIIYTKKICINYRKYISSEK